jgi:chorismate mutase
VPVRALRGATTVDDDTPEQVQSRVKALMAALFERNDLAADDVISVVVTGTPDLWSFHPATAVRAFGLAEVPILGAQELAIEGSLARCVRVLLHVETERARTELRHVFLEGARVLRPDLAGGDD